MLNPKIQHLALYAKENTITDICMVECVDSPYIQPQRLNYVENGYKKSWDFIKSHDSVSIVLHNVETDSLIVVRQFRPPVFVREGNKAAYVYELCAGLVDKPNKSIEQIAVEEVMEECGYKVGLDNLQKINTFRNSVGSSGAKQHMFYARVDSKDKHSEGGGVDGEVIEYFEIAREDLLDFLQEESIIKTPSLGFGILWFLQYTT
ncbi:MAG: NUDIX hydrolase [Helicobacter sp.]|nr:NUDIX hydrolase [Helicobacter sp.]MCI7484947.1 NUDIX hydrolase [Helicobacter sp.]